MLSRTLSLNKSLLPSKQRLIQLSSYPSAPLLRPFSSSFTIFTPNKDPSRHQGIQKASPPFKDQLKQESEASARLFGQDSKGKHQSKMQPGPNPDMMARENQRAALSSEEADEQQTTGKDLDMRSTYGLGKDLKGQDVEAFGLEMLERVEKRLQGKGDEVLEGGGREIKGRAMKRAGEVKEKGLETGEQAREKASGLKEHVMKKGGEAREKASKLKDQAMEKGGEIKEKAYELRDKAMEEGDGAKEKAYELKDKAMEEGGNLKEKVVELKDMAMEKAEEVAGKVVGMRDQAMEKAGEIKEKTAERVGEVREKAANMAGGARDEVVEKGGSITEKVMEKAAEMREMVMEKAAELKEKVVGKAEETQEAASRAKDEASRKMAGKVSDAPSPSASEVSRDEMPSFQSFQEEESKKAMKAGSRQGTLGMGHPLQVTLQGLAETVKESLNQINHEYGPDAKIHNSEPKK